MGVLGGSLFWGAHPCGHPSFCSLSHLGGKPSSFLIYSGIGVQHCLASTPPSSSKTHGF